MLQFAAMSLLKNNQCLCFLLIFFYTHTTLLHTQPLDNPYISIYNNRFTLIANRNTPNLKISYDFPSTQNVASSSINETLNIITIGESGYHAKIHLFAYDELSSTLTHIGDNTPLQTSDFISIAYLQWFNNNTQLIACIHGPINTIMTFAYENNNLSLLATAPFEQSLEYIQITPSGKFLALAYANKLSFYTISDSTIEVIHTFSFSKNISCIAWANDNQYVALIDDNTLHIYHVTADLITPIASAPCYFFNQSIYWSDNRDYIAIGSCKPTCQDNIISPNGCTIFSFDGTQLQPVT